MSNTNTNNDINNHTISFFPSTSSSSILSTTAPTTTIPITTSAFASALTALPLSSLHAKVAELRNSLIHLQSSNAQLQALLDTNASDNNGEDAGHDNNNNNNNNNNDSSSSNSSSRNNVTSRNEGHDDNDDTVVYAEAITENRELMGRLRVRIALLRREIVDVRGMEWVCGDGDEEEDKEETLVSANGARGSEEGTSLVNGEGTRTGSGGRVEESVFTIPQAGEAAVRVSENSMVGESESLRSALEQNESQPDRMLPHEEPQERPRERLGNQQDSETEGVYL